MNVVGRQLTSGYRSPVVTRGDAHIALAQADARDLVATGNQVSDAIAR